VDFAGVTLFDEIGQIARVIDVRVAQNHGVNLPGVKRKTTIALDGFLTVTLEQTAFEQKAMAVDLKQVHRAGGGARRAEKMDLHGGRKSCVALKVERDSTNLDRNRRPNLDPFCRR
jgi:hypothetical protein